MTKGRCAAVDPGKGRGEGMNRERISLWQLGLLVFVSRSVLAISGVPLPASSQAGRNAWIGVLVAVVIGTIWVYMLLVLAGRHPDETVFEYAARLLGPWIGRLVTLPLLWFFLHYGAFVLRQYGEMIVTAVLPQTPLVVIMGSMIFLSAVAVRLGIEAIGRSAEILVPFFIAAILAVQIAVLPGMRIERLAPVAAEGIRPILGGAAVSASFYSLLLTLLVIYPAVRKDGSATAVTLVASIAAGILVAINTVVTLSLFGHVEVTRLQFPFLSVARLVRLADFLERVEVFAVAAWGFGLFLELSVIFYAGAKGLAQWLGLPDHRHFVFPMGSILLTLSLVLFPHTLLVRDFVRAEVTGTYAFLVAVPIPLFLLIVSFLRGASQRGKADDSAAEGRRPR